MVYALVHDRTVADDYHAAMEAVEQRLQVVSDEQAPTDTGSGGRAQLLELVEWLAEPQLAVEARLDLVTRMRLLLRCLPPGAPVLPAVHGPPVFW